MDNAPQIFVAEVLGTGALVLLGDAVVAGVLLNRSKAQNSGWIVITTAVGVRRVRGCAHRRSVQRRPSQPGGHARCAARRWRSRWTRRSSTGPPRCSARSLAPSWSFSTTTRTGRRRRTPISSSPSTAPVPRSATTPWNFWSEFLGTFVLMFVIFIIGRAPGTRPRGTRPVAGRVPRPGHRPVTRRDHRLRDQPSPRPRARASPTSCSRSRASATPTGRTRGFPWSGHSPAPPSPTSSTTRSSPTT